ncbi:hypothetical protein [Hyphomicrobium sp.]|uniref:hypothetical protein n=1 Tax=Hyphomicrobium sp. TaxID=82 RepID=UPI002CAECDC3|nr:hypothetical protein [Hyphomicrobium sp.]HVZ03557.1 hypothetical protein [Hyphomicrobium sp.]
MRGEDPDNIKPRLGLEATPSPANRPPQDDQVKDLPRRQGRRTQQAPVDVTADVPSGRSALATQLPNRVPASTRRIEQRLTVTTRRFAVAEQSRQHHPLLPGQGGKKKRSYSGLIGFAICVGLPIVVASIYYCFFASNQYVTEFRFSVQDTSPGATSLPTGLTAVLGGGASSASNDNYLVTDYLLSRSAVEELQKRIHLIDRYSSSNIDWWSRFDSSKPIESFVPYWQSMVRANFDQVTGLATATVRAFSAEDALLIANTMVSLSEELVNKLSNRSQNDAVRFAEKEVERAQDRLRKNRAKLTEYRNRVGVIDPTASVAASNSTLVQTQRANLASLETQLATYERQNLQQNSPVVVTLKNQIKSVKEQLAATEADVGKGVNGTALSKVVGDYEQINLEVQFAQAMVTSTMQALDQARANAASQHLYITPYVRPSLPQSAVYPNRFWSVVSVGLVAFAFWIIGLLVLRSIRERFA